MDQDTHAETKVQAARAPTRRRVLQASAVAGLAAAGVGTAPLGTVAQGDTTGIDVIDVDESGWFGRWSANGSLPIVDHLFVFVHGFLASDETADEPASDVRESLASGGYDPDAAVAVSWPTVLNYDQAGGIDDAEIGDVVAGLVEDFDDAGGGAIRLVGHSLGARIAFETLASLSGGSEIETVVTLGAAADGSEVCGDPWNDALDRACAVRNYHSRNDQSVGSAYGGSGDTALGAAGAGCDPAGNYTDVDVTDAVDTHSAYLGSATLGSDLADAIAAGSCGDGGSDDGNGDGGTGATTDTSGVSGTWGWGADTVSSTGSASSGGGSTGWW